jgi:hypothetical protein
LPVQSIALSRAMARCFERNRGGPGKVSPEADSIDDVELTSIETLILSCICSQGIPICDDNVAPLVPEDKKVDIVPPEQSELSLCWTGLGKIVVAAAKVWQSCSAKKVEELQENYDKYEGGDDTTAKLRAQRSLANAIRIEDCKSLTVAQASDYASEPHVLASKTVMMLQKLRLMMGHNGDVRDKSAKKSNFG